MNDEITAAMLAELRHGDLIELHHREHFGYLIRGYVRGRGGTLRLGGMVLSWPPTGWPYSWLKDFRLVVIERAADRLYENSLRAQPVRGDVVRFQDLNDEIDSYTNVYLPFRREEDGYPWVDLDTGTRWSNKDALPHGNGTQSSYRITLLVDGTTGLPPAEVTW